MFLKHLLFHIQFYKYTHQEHNIFNFRQKFKQVQNQILSNNCVQQQLKEESILKTVKIKSSIYRLIYRHKDGIFSSTFTHCNLQHTRLISHQAN